MDEDKGNNIQNDQEADGEEFADQKQPEYHEISKDELKQILEDHRKWLESDGKEGVKIELRNANLQEAILNEANLQEASLFRANLKKANLIGANLQEAALLEANLQEAILYQANLKQAFLYDANLQEAKLTGANLQNAYLLNANLKNATLNGVDGLTKANLQYANLEGATGLLGNEFAQADVTGIKLPDGIKDFKALEIVKETSQNARKMFFAMLLGCVYSWLTIATTTDVKLLTNTASSPLPIIGTEIPIAWFYIAAPLVLICIYFYFHLYLIKLWEALSKLPAIFPDGKRLDERAYPWLLAGLVRRHFKLLKNNRPFIAHVQEWITIFLSWWVVPITMIAFWLRFIPRQDWWGTGFHIGLIVCSIGFAIFFYRLCALTLKSEKIDIVSIKSIHYDKRPILGTMILLVGMFFLLLSYGSIKGVRIGYYQKVTNIQEAVPLAFNKLGFEVFANFREKNVSERPSNYGQIDKEERLEFVKGANLNGINLNNADMTKAFLVKTDMREATLKKANLYSANLQYANLEYANLQEANLFKANLKNINLSNAKLFKTNLDSADLFKANLKLAKLQKAKLSFANLQEADLSDAKLQNANLESTNLQNAILSVANLQEAKFSGANLQGAKIDYGNLKYARLAGANLKGAKLQYANLQGAMLYDACLQNTNLVGVKLQGAILDSANLQKANFAGADLQNVDLHAANLQDANFISVGHLSKAKNLTVNQLCSAITLYNTKIEPNLLEQVKRKCPNLLEEHKD